MLWFYNSPEKYGAVVARMLGAVLLCGRCIRTCAVSAYPLRPFFALCNLVLLWSLKAPTDRQALPCSWCSPPIMIYCMLVTCAACTLCLHAPWRGFPHRCSGLRAVSCSLAFLMLPVASLLALSLLRFSYRCLRLRAV